MDNQHLLTYSLAGLALLYLLSQFVRPRAPNVCSHDHHAIDLSKG